MVEEQIFGLFHHWYSLSIFLVFKNSFTARKWRPAITAQEFEKVYIYRAQPPQYNSHDKGSREDLGMQKRAKY